MEQKANQAEFILDKCAGIQYKKNNFGDIYPQWDTIAPEQLCGQLSFFVTIATNQFKKSPIIIEVPHEKAAAFDAIKKAGFTFYHGNNERTEWICKNNSSIPDPYTSTLDVAIVIRKKNFVLVVEKKTQPGSLGFPMGSVNKQELSRNAAVRNLFNNIKSTINPDDLKLFAITNNTDTNRFKANNVTHYYTVDYSKVSGNLIPNPDEIIQATYVSLQEIAQQKTVNKLPILPTVRALAGHLVNAHSQTYHKIISLSTKHPQKNTISIEFIAQ